MLIITVLYSIYTYYRTHLIQIPSIGLLTLCVVFGFLTSIWRKKHTHVNPILKMNLLVHVTGAVNANIC